MSETSKKPYLIIAIVLTVLAVMTVAVKLSDSEKQNALSLWRVPSIFEIDAETSPIMYDYTCGCLGNHSHESFQHEMMGLDSTYHVFCFKNDEHDAYYISTYFPHTNERMLPSNGSDPICWYENAAEVKQYLDENADLILHEDSIGCYDFYFIKNEVPGVEDLIVGPLQVEHWRNLYISEALYTDELMNGSGWDSQYIRSNPTLAANLKVIEGVDIYDSFWDKYRYMSIIQLTNKNDQNMAPLYVVPLGPDKFSIDDSVYSKAEIDNICNENNLITLDEAVDNNCYGVYYKFNVSE